jgi:uncharacterized protein
MRASRYNIFVQLEDRSEQVFLVHGYTFAFDIISKTLYYCLNGINDKSIDDINAQTLNTLIERGYVTNKSRDEEFQYIEEISVLPIDLCGRLCRNIRAKRFRGHI